jgi:Tfp pilus assembly protein PilF
VGSTRGVALIVVFVLLGGGCSGGDETELTRDQFVSRVDSLCRKAERAADPHLVRVIEALSAEDYPRAGDELEKAIEVHSEVYGEIAAVDAPSQAEADFARFLELNRKAEERYMLAVQELRENDIAGFGAVDFEKEPGLLHIVALRLGLTDCSDPDPVE